MKNNPTTHQALRSIGSAGGETARSLDHVNSSLSSSGVSHFASQESLQRDKTTEVAEFSKTAPTNLRLDNVTHIEDLECVEGLYSQIEDARDSPKTFIDDLLEAAASTSETDLLSPTLLPESHSIAWMCDDQVASDYVVPSPTSCNLRDATLSISSSTSACVPTFTEREGVNTASTKLMSPHGTIAADISRIKDSPSSILTLSSPGTISMSSLNSTSPLSQTESSTAGVHTMAVNRSGYDNNSGNVSDSSPVRSHLFSNGPLRASPIHGDEIKLDQTLRSVQSSHLPDRSFQKLSLICSKYLTPLTSLVQGTFHAIFHEADLYLAACVGSVLFYMVSTFIVTGFRLYLNLTHSAESAKTGGSKHILLSTALWEMRLLETLFLSTTASRALIASQLAIKLSASLARYHALIYALLTSTTGHALSQHQFERDHYNRDGNNAQNRMEPHFKSATSRAKSASATANDAHISSSFAKRILPYTELLIELTIPPIIYFLMKIFGSVSVTAVLSTALSFRLYALRRPAPEACAFGLLYTATAFMGCAVVSGMFRLIMSGDLISELMSSSAWDRATLLHSCLEYIIGCFVIAVNIAQDMHTTHPWLERQMKSASRRRAKLFYISWFGSVLLMTFAFALTGGTVLPAAYFALREVHGYIRDRVPENVDD